MIVAATFLVLAVALFASSYSLPEAAGSVPGPGFFPRTIGAVMALLAGALLVAGRTRNTALGDYRTATLAAALTLAYLLAWGVGPFALRTIIFMTLFLRLVGQDWRSSAGVAVALTAFVALTFQLGLRVSL